MIYISNNSKASNTAFEHSTVQKHMLRFVQGKHGYMSMQ